MTRVVLAILFLCAPAMAQTVIMKTPATPLEVCENNRVHLNSLHAELEKANSQLVARIISLNAEIKALKERKPVAAKPKKKVQVCGSRKQVWRTLPNGYKKYRCM